MIRGSEVEKLVTLGYFGVLELVPLGHVGTLDGCCFLGVLVAHGICLERPIRLWCVAQPCSSWSFGSYEDIVGSHQLSCGVCLGLGASSLGSSVHLVKTLQLVECDSSLFVSELW